MQTSIQVSLSAATGCDGSTLAAHSTAASNSELLYCSVPADFLRSMFKRIDWKAFLVGAQAVSEAAVECQLAAA